MKIFAAFLAIALIATVSVADTLVDGALAARAEVVLRVKRLASGDEADKYRWYRVEVLEVLKNNSPEQFSGPFSVAAYSWDSGVPSGESTLYLERYSEVASQGWKLVGGRAATGISHAEAPQ